MSGVVDYVASVLTKADTKSIERNTIERAERIMSLCRLTPAEIVLLKTMAYECKMGSTPFHESFLSMAQSIENGGAEQRDKLLEWAVLRSGERDASLQLYGFVREEIPKLVAQVERGRTEGDAKREFREKLGLFLHKMYPDATPAAIALTVGQSFEDTPGVWTFRTERVVLALRNPKRL